MNSRDEACEHEISERVGALCAALDDAGADVRVIVEECQPDPSRGATVWTASVATNTDSELAALVGGYAWQRGATARIATDELLARITERVGWRIENATEDFARAQEWLTKWLAASAAWSR